MAQEYFTLEEANEALAAVRPLAERMVEHRRALAAAQERQGEFSRVIAGDGGDLQPRELAEVLAAVENETAAIARCVAGIEALGAQVKDAERGLVDFPSIREGEEVLLCWHVGEDAIEYWHGADEGFAGRKPV